MGASSWAIPRRVLGMTRPARRFLLRAWLGAPLVELSLAHLGLRATLAWVDRIPRRGVGEGVGVAEARDLVGATYRHHLVRGRCLPRAVLQYAIHRRDGVDAELRIGVQREGAGLDAHAWVVARGEAVSEPFETILVRSVSS